MNNATQGLDLNSINIDVDASIYSEPAIIQAANLYTGKYHCTINRLSASVIRIQLCTKVGSSATNGLDTISKDLLNDIIDYQIRLDLDSKNRKLKEMIVKQAFDPAAKLPSNSRE